MAEKTVTRVERGAALLDARRPGWDALIDLGKLDLNNPWRCVLGQTYGGYAEGVDTLFHRDPGEGYRYGFSSVWDEGYDVLTESWRELITARRAGA